MPQDKPGLPDNLQEDLVSEIGTVEQASRQVLDRLLKASLTALSAQDSSILMPDTSETLTFFHSTNPKILALDLPSVPINESIAGFVYLTAQTMTFDQVAKAPKFYDEIDKHLGYATKEYLATPIVDGEAVLGVLTFVNRTGDQGSFSQDETKLADECARACGLLIEYILTVRQNAKATSDRLCSHFGNSAQPAAFPDEVPLLGGAGAQAGHTARQEVVNALKQMQESDVELIRDLVRRLLDNDDSGLVF